MKRLMAALLTGCLAFQAWIGVATPVYGAEVPAGTAVESSLPGQPDALTDEEDVSRSGAVSRAAGQEESIIEVEVRSLERFPLKGTAQVVLHGSGGEVVKSETLDFGGSDASSRTARFDVPAGDYTAEVSASGFASYRQQIHADANWSNRILVCTARTEDEGGSTAGWLCPGDVDGDGTISETDTRMLTDAVRNGSSDAKYDINGDGKTDLADLQSAVQSLGESSTSQIQKRALLQNAQASEGTTVEGSMEDFLNHTGSITLKPADTDAQISKENPVGMEFTLAPEETANPQEVPEIGGLTIHASGDLDEDGNVVSDIADGEAVIAYLDADGNEQEEAISLRSEERRVGKECL